MPFITTVPPTTEPVTLKQVKQQSRLYADVTDEDDVVLLYLQVAREMIEAETGQACMERTLQAYFHGFPNCFSDSPRELELPVSPAASVSSVEYRDESGAWVEMPPADWELAGVQMPGRVVLAADASWPSDTYGQRNESVRVTYVAGRVEAGLVPLKLRQAILLQAAFLYDNRVPVSDRKSFVLARGIDTMISLERVRVI